MRIAVRFVPLVVSVAVLAACGRHEPAALPEPPPVAAPLATAERVAAPGRVELAGAVEASRSSAVSSRVMALVTAVHVDLGDAVAAGQLLVSIDPTSAQGQVDQAEGALAQARAALALAERNHERYANLAKSDSASELELDMARTGLEQARGAVRQAEGAVAAAGAVARESRVVAPFAGRVAARAVEVGDLAAPGRPLVTIESAAGRRFVVAVPEAIQAAANLAPGAVVPVRLDARPELGEIEGRVAEVSPGPDPRSHAYTVRIDLPDTGLPAGAAGRVALGTAPTEAVLVPREAVISSGGLDLVVVATDENRAASRVVTLGRQRADGKVEVLSGLQGGERVALGLAAAPPAGARIEAAR